MLTKSTLQLLRFHFSFFLLPVYLFALSQAPYIQWGKAAWAFGILHLLVYPASNGYNSYMDRDESPIGGLSSPMQPTRQLFITSVVMDALAIALAHLVSVVFVVGIMVYILFSRAYSYRGIRLKKYPVIGFLTVFICQGALIFFIVYKTVSDAPAVPWLPLLLASLLIGALYPLTQVYQHEADRADGVTTISYLLGKRGSFVFSMALFLAATAGFYVLFQAQGQYNYFGLFLLVMLPVVLFFLYWMRLVWADGTAADFKNSLRMNVLSTVCTTAYFTTLLILNH